MADIPCGGTTTANRVARWPRGLSLLELLVVVAMLMMLMALLVPSLRGAREQTRRAVCLANLHQIGLGVQYYLDDNRGSYWRYHLPQTGGRRWWFGFEPGGPVEGKQRPLDKSQGVLAPYTQSVAKLLQCPAFPYHNGCYFPKFADRSSSYGYNLLLGPPNPRTPAARSGDFANRPSRVFVFADGAHFDHNPGMNEGVYIAHEKDPNRKGGYAHFRHRGQAMVLFMDAHAEGQPLRGPAHPIACAGPAGNLASADGSSAIYGQSQYGTN